MNRRGFLGLIGAAAVGMAVGTGLASKSVEVPEPWVPMDEHAVTADRYVGGWNRDVVLDCEKGEMWQGTESEQFERFKRIRAEKLDEMYRQTENMIWHVPDTLSMERASC